MVAISEIKLELNCSVATCFTATSCSPALKFLLLSLTSIVSTSAASPLPPSGCNSLASSRKEALTPSWKETGVPTDCHKSNGSSYIMDELDVQQPTYMATSDPNLSKLSSYLTSSSWLMERRWIQLPHAIKKYRAKTGSTQNWPTNFNFCFPSSPELNVRRRQPAFSFERKPHRTGEPKNIGIV